MLDLTRPADSQCISSLKKKMLLKIQLGKNFFEMLKLPLGGDKDAGSPFYFGIKTTFNLPSATIPLVINCVFINITDHV